MHRHIKRGTVKKYVDAAYVNLGNYSPADLVKRIRDEAER